MVERSQGLTVVVAHRRQRSQDVSIGEDDCAGVRDVRALGQMDSATRQRGSLTETALCEIAVASEGAPAGRDHDANPNAAM